MPEQVSEPVAEPAAVPATRTVAENRAGSPLGVSPVALLRLQRTAGNRATGQLLRRTLAREVTLDPITVEGVPWDVDNVKAVQTELTRLRLYDKGIDGKPGFFTNQAMMEAFGGYGWGSLSDAELLAALKAVPTPPVRSGHRLRYGSMFADGVLDVTLGIGYLEDQTDYMVKVQQGVGGELAGLGLTKDRDTAVRVLAKAGRTIASGAIGDFWVKEGAIHYQPMVGQARDIDVVVRIVLNPGGDRGGEALDAFLAAMTQGDIAYYEGHGRYGSGPDFDPNFGSFTITFGDGSIQKLTDYEVLEKTLADMGGDPWTKFLEGVKAGWLVVEITDAGNLWINAHDAHANEFGGKLIYWALERGGKLATGKSGALATGAAKGMDYRVLVFSGCRTEDYDAALRQTPGFDTRHADIIETTRTIRGGGEIATFTAFLKDVMAQSSGEQAIVDMGAAMKAHEAKYEGGPYRFSGLADNPSM